MTQLTLKRPLTVGRKTIEQLTFREYTTAADYLSFDEKGGVAQNIALIANLTGTDEALIRQLSGVDYRQAIRIADEMITNDQILADQPNNEKKESAS